MEEEGQEEPLQVQVEGRNRAGCTHSSQGEEEEGVEEEEEGVVEEDRRREEPLKRSPNPFYG